MTIAYNHNQIYSKAKYYDIAFSFKNIEEENQTLLDLYHKYNGRDATSFLDIGAGPAANATQMAIRGLKSWAVDYSPDMVAYGLAQAASQGVVLKYLQGDMRSFNLSEPVDMAAIFMDSTSYLLTNEDVINHLRAVAQNLNKNGLYILEMSHPRDIFNVSKSASTEWSIERDGIEASVNWGQASDIFDPIKQTTMVTAKLKYKSLHAEGEIIDYSEQRCFTFNEVKALVMASGCFDLIDVVGSLKPHVSFSNKKESWRMVPVLRRKNV